MSALAQTGAPEALRYFRRLSILEKNGKRRDVIERLLPVAEARYAEREQEKRQSRPGG